MRELQTESLPFEVVEHQKQENNSCKKLLVTGTRKAGQI